MISKAVALKVIEDARAVIAAHERHTRDGDLEAIVAAVADDIVLLAGNAPLIAGRAAFREFYRDLLARGTWDLEHEYMGAELVADVVLLHGVARGTFTPVAGDPQPIRNNFLLMLKREGEALKVWRGAFAPAQ